MNISEKQKEACKIFGYEDQNFEFSCQVSNTSTKEKGSLLLFYEEKAFGRNSEKGLRFNKHPVYTYGDDADSTKATESLSIGIAIVKAIKHLEKQGATEVGIALFADFLLDCYSKIQ